MPKGARCREAGMLRHNHFGYVLEVDSGGFWVLEIWSMRRVSHFLDQRVIVEGVRIGFNILDVDCIKRDGGDQPSAQSWTPWFARWWKLTVK